VLDLLGEVAGEKPQAFSVMAGAFSIPAPANPPANSTAFYVLISLYVPSAALYVIEYALFGGFDSYRAHHPLTNQALTN
jgi:hypothetical protein